jgi:cyclophilin family peptidyl-prolyl cis-trans isomerase
MIRSLLLLTLVPAAIAAQNPAGTPIDSALVGRILLAEDRRDSTDRVLTEGERHADPRVQALARRARQRITDPRFAARDSLATLSPLAMPPSWPEPTWRVRYRALAAPRDDCVALRAALADSVWPVRLRAADLVTQTCAGDDALLGVLRRWIDDLPNTPTRRKRGDVSWHAAAHAVVALARARPDDARPRIIRLSRHRQWHVRLYAARAAAVLADAERLRVLARDRDANVREAAIDALSRVTAHADDAIYLDALQSDAPQVVRAAAIALKGSPRDDVRGVANVVFARWVRRENASERDVRRALLEAAGRHIGDDVEPFKTAVLPPRAVELALGADIRLRVTMTDWSGGGSFVVRLRGDVAPLMAARVLELARGRYYNQGTWHRVEHDFVIQGGAHGDNEYVGYEKFFRDELGTVPHVRGTVGMSTRGHDTGDAQWFINLKDNLRLGRDYTVFAEVVEGIDVVDDIMEGDIIATIAEVRERQ